MLKYNALIAGLVALAVWALTRQTLPEAASNVLIAIAILCTAFGAIAHKPAAHKPTRRRRKLSPAARAKRDARKAERIK